jgi:hypothetical protein
MVPVRFSLKGALFSHRFDEKQHADKKENEMFSTLKTATLSAMIGLGAIAAMPAAAQADGLYLNYGGGQYNSGAGVYVGDGERADYRHDRRYDRRYQRFCTPDRALDKAVRLGLRRAHVVDVDRHTIKVSGRKHGDRVRVTFARAPNCPIVRW